jgi:hypothetical protein
MASLASDLISVLGKYDTDADVRRVIAEHDLLDTFDDPPLWRRYVGSDRKGIDLLFEEGRVIDVQVFVEPDASHSAFSADLPFGIQRGMTQQQIHELLGEPESSDEIDSRYFMVDYPLRLMVVYDRTGTVRYLSLCLPEDVPGRR